MNRRKFVAGSLAAAAGGLIVPRLGSAVFANNSPMLTDSLFESDNPELIKMADEVFGRCVIAKIRPPEGTLMQPWLQAGTGDAFYGQWIWDAMFEVDLLAILPDKKDVVRGIFKNYWDFQVRWNALRPGYAHDMIPCMIEPRNTETWNEYPAYSQIPILGWGLERVWKRNADKELLRQSLVQLEKFHEWYWRERDVRNSGLVAVGSYSSVTQHARYETFDNECNLDDLHMTPHPIRKGPGEGDWYGDICLPGITAYLVGSERSLIRLAEEVGDEAMAARRLKRVDKSVDAMRRHMWDESSGTFLAVRRDTLEKIPVATIGSWMPLMAEVPTRKMAKRMAEAFMTEHWQTPLPIPTVDRMDKTFVANSYWRGDVWPAPNYQVAHGFAAYGYNEIAADICDKTIANALKNGINEHYDSITGQPLGVPWLGMSCTIVAMMLDGLSKTYKLNIKGK
jgi:glycogen debranching enzyme